MGENPKHDEPQQGGSEQDGPPSLSAFSDRLEKMRGQTQEPEPKGSANAWGRALRISSDLLAGLFVGCLFGVGLDHWLGTKPLFLLLGIGFGFAAGLRNMARTLKNETEQSSQE